MAILLLFLLGCSVALFLNGERLQAKLDDAQLQIERLKHDTGCRVDYSIDGEHWTQGTEFPCYPYMRVERFK